MSVLSLDVIRDPAAAGLYPRRVLDGCESALVLFAAAWHGKQDAVWIAEAGLTGTCVDLDGEKLDEMAAVYPDGWEFAAEDAFVFATRAQRRWDVVSIDCPTNLFDRCADLVPLWCLLARKAVVLGSGSGVVADPPKGWRMTETVRRSSFNGGVYWTVLEAA